MTSWRDSLSKTVAGEMDELLDASLKAAKERLDADDVLLPFVQVVEDDGSQGTRMVEIVEDVRPDQLLEELFEKLRAERDQVRAVAVVFDAIVGGARAGRSRHPRVARVVEPWSAKVLRRTLPRPRAATPANSWPRSSTLVTRWRRSAESPNANRHFRCSSAGL